MVNGFLKKRSNWKIALAVGWIFCTVAMAVWWFYLGTSFLTQLENHEIFKQELALRQKNMLIWEGLAWMVFLFGGGITLIFLISRERFQSQSLRQFLATFSHDVKTALASLRLQTDILREEVGDIPAINRLDSDVVRLQLQLENSLFLASQKDLQFFIENLSLRQLIESYRENWPNLKIDLNQDAVVRADRRALDSIFGNLIQNAQVHGRAKNISISVKRIDSCLIEVRVSDTGKGFGGDLANLGSLFERHNPSSGSGVGLYSVVVLVKRMGGRVSFSNSPETGGGFCVTLHLPGSLL